MNLDQHANILITKIHHLSGIKEVKTDKTLQEQTLLTVTDVYNKLALLPDIADTELDRLIQLALLNYVRDMVYAYLWYNSSVKNVPVLGKTLAKLHITFTVWNRLRKDKGEFRVRKHI